MVTEKGIEKNTERIISVRKIDEEVKDLILLFNDYANELRNLLHQEIEIPFKLDKMLEIEIEYDEPIRLNEFYSKEIFNSAKVYVTGLRIIDGAIQFWLRDIKGNVITEKIYLGENAGKLQVWEYYLIALVSQTIPIYTEDKRAELASFYSELKELVNNAK